MRVRSVLVVLVGAAYVAGCHWLMTSAPAAPWNAVVVIGPMLGLLVLFAARRGWRVVAGAAFLGLDSIDILEVALVVSQRYGFQLRSDDEDNVRIFRSLASLAEHIAANRQPA